MHLLKGVHAFSTAGSRAAHRLQAEERTRPALRGHSAIPKGTVSEGGQKSEVRGTAHLWLLPYKGKRMSREEQVHI